LSTTPTRTPRRNRKAKSQKSGPGPKRLNKKSGDVRSLPDRATAPAGKIGGKAIRHLRGLGHHLDAIVQIGKEGITDALVDAAKEALLAHELVKVRVGSEAPVDRKDAGAELAERTGATLAQTLGRTFLLYKRHPNKPKITLPRG
jgi:RNA-binding protein